MRRRVALGLVIVGAALGIAFVVVLVRPILDRPSGGEPSPEGFSGLQPLAEDLAWVYETVSADVPEPGVPLVMAIVGKESAGGEAGWLFQTGIGQAPWTTRLVLVDRGGEIGRSRPTGSRTGAGNASRSRHPSSSSRSAATRRGRWTTRAGPRRGASAGLGRSARVVG